LRTEGDAILIQGRSTIVVAGCQRSGTTLVGQILGAHPKAFLIDEPDGLYQCFDAAVVGEIPKELEQRTLRRANEKYVTPEERLHRRGDSVELAPGVTHLVLKAPNLTHRFPEFTRLRNAVSVVFPVRDPRAVVASMARLGHVPMADRQAEYLSSRPYLQQWYAKELVILRDKAQPLHVRRALVWRIKTMMYQKMSVVGIPTFSFRYEDLIANQGRLVLAMAQHVGLAPSEQMLAYPKVFRGWGPGLTERKRPIDDASLETWRDSLSQEELQQVVELTRCDMETLGYTPGDVEAPNAAS
jgi:hypothetical protein